MYRYADKTAVNPPPDGAGPHPIGDFLQLTVPGFGVDFLCRQMQLGGNGRTGTV